MEIKKRAISKNEASNSKSQAGRKVKVAKYNCITTNTVGLFKIDRPQGGYLVRLNYGKREKVDEKLGKIGYEAYIEQM